MKHSISWPKKGDGFSIKQLSYFIRPKKKKMLSLFYHVVRVLKRTYLLLFFLGNSILQKRTREQQLLEQWKLQLHLLSFGFFLQIEDYMYHIHVCIQASFRKLWYLIIYVACNYFNCTFLSGAQHFPNGVSSDYIIRVMIYTFFFC